MEDEANEQTKPADLHCIMEWIESQPHLPVISEPEAVRFLHACYYDMESTKSAIDSYFTFRTSYPELFAINLGCELLKRTLDVALIAVLPQKTPEGFNVLCVKFVDPHPDNYDQTTYFKLMDMVLSLDIYSEDKNDGYYILIDAQGIAMGHLSKTNLFKAKRFIDYLQEGIPMRLKGIHFINLTPFTQRILDMVKSLMKAELRQMIHTHAEPYDSLYVSIPKYCFPSDFGGTENLTVADLMSRNKRKIYDNSEFFAQQQNKSIDESKRPQRLNWLRGFWR